MRRSLLHYSIGEPFPPSGMALGLYRKPLTRGEAPTGAPSTGCPFPRHVAPVSSPENFFRRSHVVYRFGLSSRRRYTTPLDRFGGCPTPCGRGSYGSRLPALLFDIGTPHGCPFSVVAKLPGVRGRPPCDRSLRPLNVARDGMKIREKTHRVDREGRL